MEGVLAPGDRCALGAEEKWRVLEVMEGNVGAPVTLWHLHGSVSQSSRDSRACGHCSGNCQQRPGAGDLAGMGSLLGLGHPGSPWGSKAAMLPWDEFALAEHCSGSSSSLLRTCFSISNIHLQHQGLSSKSPSPLPFAFAPSTIWMP